MTFDQFVWCIMYFTAGLSLIGWALLIKAIFSR